MVFNKSDVSKILVIQFRPFGDVLMATSYLAALREAFPQAQIDFLVFKPYDLILKNNPYISHVITWRKIANPTFIFHWIIFLWRLRRERYDLVIDQHFGTGSAEVVAAVGAKYRLGWRHSRFKCLYNLVATRGKPIYNAVRNLNMLKPLGIEVNEPVLFYHIDKESEELATRWIAEKQLNPQKLIMFSPGCKIPSRQWSRDRYSRLARILTEKHGYSVVVLWAPNEEDDARYVVNTANYPNVLLAPPTTLNEGAAFVKNSLLLVCNTCGLMHIGVATGAKTLTIFGPTKPDQWTAQGLIPGHCHLHNPEGIKEEKNGFGITPEMVADKVCEMLEVK